MKEIRKYGPFTGKNKLIKSFSEETQTLELLDKDIK